MKYSESLKCEKCDMFLESYIDDNTGNIFEQAGTEKVIVYSNSFQELKKKKNSLLMT